MADASDPTNGAYVETAAVDGGPNEAERPTPTTTNKEKKTPSFQEEEITLYTIFNRLVAAIIFTNSDVSNQSSPPLLLRIRGFLSENVPLFQVAFKNSAHNVLLWARRGSPLRALLVVSVGTVALLALTGLLAFMLFFVAATVNAIVISLLMSLAAAGGFLALFFACVTAIYIGALTIAIFVISTTTISAIVAVLIATGWIGFLLTVWLVTKKGVGVAKHSLSMTGSMVSAYSSSRFARQRHESDNFSNK